MDGNEKIKGVVEHVNATPGKMPGIKVNGTWFNSNLTTLKYVKMSKPGQMVEFELDQNGKIGYLTVILPEEGQSIGEPQKGAYKPNNALYKPISHHSSTGGVDWGAKDRLIVRQSSLKCAVELCVAGHIKTVDVEKQAEIFTKWVYEEPIFPDEQLQYTEEPLGGQK